MNLPTWKRIWLGQGVRTISDYFHWFNNEDVHVEEIAYNMMRQEAFSVAPEPMPIDLVLVPTEISSKRVWDRQEMNDEIIACGLALCPPEVGPCLRLAWKDQLASDDVSDWVAIAMEPIRAANHRNNNFLLLHDTRLQRLSLSTWSAQLYPDARLVAARSNPIGD